MTQAQRFKYNNRGLNDGERTAKLIRGAELRRLTYADQISSRDENGQIRPGCNQLPK